MATYINANNQQNRIMVESKSSETKTQQSQASKFSNALTCVKNSAVALTVMMTGAVAYVAAVGGSLMLMNDNLTAPFPLKAAVVSATGVTIGGICGTAAALSGAIGAFKLMGNTSGENGFSGIILMPIAGVGAIAGAVLGGTAGLVTAAIK